MPTSSAFPTTSTSPRYSDRVPHSSGSQVSHRRHPLRSSYHRTRTSLSHRLDWIYCGYSRSLPRMRNVGRGRACRGHWQFLAILPDSWSLHWIPMTDIPAEPIPYSDPICYGWLSWWRSCSDATARRSASGWSAPPASRLLFGGTGRNVCFATLLHSGTGAVARILGNRGLSWSIGLCENLLVVASFYPFLMFLFKFL